MVFQYMENHAGQYGIDIEELKSFLRKMYMIKGDINTHNVETENIFKKVVPKDLVKFGMVPEFVGRFTEPKDKENDLSNEDALDIAFDRSENT